MSRRYPKGRLGPDDDGELLMSIAIHRGRVIVQFGEPVKWIGLDAGDARKLSLSLRQRADELDPPQLAILPEVNRVPHNVAGLACHEIEELHVSSYAPLPGGKGPCTEVHLRIDLPGGGPSLVMRFHGPGTLDQLIGALVRHRNDVWPQAASRQDDSTPPP